MLMHLHSFIIHSFFKSLLTTFNVPGCVNDPAIFLSNEWSKWHWAHFIAVDRRQWKAEEPDLWRSNWGKTKIKFLDSLFSFGLVWLRAIVPKPGIVAASSGHSGSCLGTFLSVMMRGWEDHCIWWVEARDAAQHLSMPWTPHIKLWLGSTCQ